MYKFELANFSKQSEINQAEICNIQRLSLIVLVVCGLRQLGLYKQNEKVIESPKNTAISPQVLMVKYIYT